MKASWLAHYKLHAARPIFRHKVHSAKRLLSAFLDRMQRPYVSWSGGKDSTCLLLLLHEIGRIDVPVFTQSDDLDWPEKREHCHRVVQWLGFTDYEYRESKVSAAAQFARAAAGDEIVGTFSHVVQQYVTDRQHDGVIVGIRAEESGGRKALTQARGKLFHAGGQWRCHPIADWSGVDVFAMIVSRGAPYMPLYDCDARAPHEWRMSWPATPAFWKSGAAAELRRYFPAYFARLAELNPALREHA